jgi:hypothetical protein
MSAAAARTNGVCRRVLLLLVSGSSEDMDRGTSLFWTEHCQSIALTPC